MLDLHAEMLLEEYDAQLPVYQRLETVVQQTLEQALERNGIIVTAVSTRIKTRESLEGKLALKGSKYQSLSDITDILGARIITFYTDDVDRIAAIAEQMFDVDWENSIDKRALHQIDSFGYNSLHYICRLPKKMVDDPYCPELNQIRFELQLRTTLQHAINRMSGLLELADDEFSRIRTEITDYRRRVQQLVQSGKLDDVQLDGDTFNSYLQARPFDSLNKRIAAINQAEIQEVSLDEYLRVFRALGCKTLGDVHRLKKQYEDNAYRLARYQLGNTDLDIISSAVGIQNICIVCILSTGGGKLGLVRFFNVVNGVNSQNEAIAELTYEQAKSLQL